ncbi:MAG TPA: PLP-dependent transferase, partial [Steroidobacteraceae bacterium]|nr:PLP-dependent transferase [Steroidobacteraceae bacterium]
MTQEANETTRVVRAALETDTQHGAVVPPIHLTSTFAFVRYGQKRGYDYSRSGNPTRDALAGAVADLEGGTGAVITSSGMAAVTLVAQLFRPDDLAVVPHDCYG